MPEGERLARPPLWAWWTVTPSATAQVIDRADNDTSQGFIHDHVAQGAVVYTDEASAYRNLDGYRHEAVSHSAGEYVRNMAHTNGVESFWAMLRTGLHRHVPPPLPQAPAALHVDEFAGHNGFRDLDTFHQMGTIATALAGTRLMYEGLIG